MTSEKRRAANRANAARSTGPRTPEGKARSAWNAVQHNFAATSFAVVRLEDIEEVGRLKADFVALYRPVNSQEMIAIERIAVAQQALFRVSRLESGILTHCLNEAMAGDGHHFFPMTEAMVSTDIAVVQAQNRNYALAHGFARLASSSNSFMLFLRYQSQTERLYRRAIEEFERLKALREQLPNESIFTDQPEPPQPLTPRETNPPATPEPDGRHQPVRPALRPATPAPGPRPASEASHLTPDPASHASQARAPASAARKRPTVPSRAIPASKSEIPSVLKPPTSNHHLSATSRGIGLARNQE
ncbi:MAG TPA: hypothetical protein VGS58_06540 [Candidatus Sulfopaludibacter sp.]|nr:hypothetical protein [Candidatus Sulfopaludibacter sp.]